MRGVGKIRGKLLIDEYPIQVLPNLAKKVGLNEAIFLQQLHYWLNGKSAKHKDGHKWIYNTYKDWEEQFPFWSNATIRRIINSCEKQELIITTSKYNKFGYDNTKWYSVNYEAIDALSTSLLKVSKGLAQIEQGDESERASGTAQNEQTNTIDYPETTSETTKDIVEQSSQSDKSDNIPYKEIVDYLNDKTGSNYRSGTKATQRLIKARINDGFELEDFKKVIDVKVDDWLNNKMAEYLRPQTLFGTKFESYLNQPSTDNNSKWGFNDVSEYEGLQ